MKRSNSVLIWLIAIGLLLFTGFRSIHLVQTTLPGDSQVLAFAALAALDLGVLAWTFYANGGARGAQRTIALLMVVVDFAGVAAATLADTLLITGNNAELVGTVAAWIVPIVICANVGAVIAVHVMDPTQVVRDAEREAEEELQRQLAEQIRANAGQLAGSVTPEMLALRQAELASRFKAGLRNGKLPGSITLAADAPVDTLGNAQGPERPKGRKVVNGEVTQ